MKKWFVFALILMLCLSLCACDMEAIMDGLGDMMENEESQAPMQEQVTDNMFIIQEGEEGSGSIGTVITVVGENSVVVGEGSTIEIIDGVAYVDGKPVEITEGDGSWSYIVEIEPEE